MAIGDMRQDRKAERDARDELRRAERLSRMADRPLRTPDNMAQRVRPAIPGMAPPMGAPIRPVAGYPVPSGQPVDPEMLQQFMSQQAMDEMIKLPRPMQTAPGGGIAGLKGLYGQMSGDMAPMPRTMPMQVPTQPMGKGGQMPSQPPQMQTQSGGKGASSPGMGAALASQFGLFL